MIRGICTRPGHKQNGHSSASFFSIVRFPEREIFAADSDCEFHTTLQIIVEEATTCDSTDWLKILYELCQLKMKWKAPHTEQLTRNQRERLIRSFLISIIT